MSDNNLPAEKAGPVADAPTEEELIGDIADLIEDPAEDPQDETEAKGAETDPDEPEIDVSEDVDQDDADEPDGSQDAEIKGGRFAPDSAKVTLEDGSVITVAELKRNNLFQRDYTRKTTELAAEREQITVRASEVDQQAQSLAQQVEYLNWYAEHYLPKAPEPFQGTPDTDPIGYMKHMQAVQEWQQHQQLIAYFNGERENLTQQQQAKAKQEAEQRLQSEFSLLREKDRLFTDPVKTRAFLEEAVSKGAEWWGLTAEEVGALANHKAYLILRDAMRYRKAVARAPEAQKQVQAKPVMAKGGRRFDPKSKVSAEKQARSERLRRDGTFEAGVASLMDLDL